MMATRNGESFTRERLISIMIGAAIGIAFGALDTLAFALLK
jgi:hypothetical protein